MLCFNCQTVCADGANFCPGCGRQSRAPSAKTHGPNQFSPLRNAKAYPYEESMAQWNGLQRKRLFSALLWGVLLAVPGAVIGWAYFASTGAVFLGAVLGINTYMYVRLVRRDHYYSIAHSCDAHGDHRCIFCGNRGIYKKGEYKTNNTHCHCSKCEELLFSE